MTRPRRNSRVPLFFFLHSAIGLAALLSPLSRLSLALFAQPRLPLVDEYSAQLMRMLGEALGTREWNNEIVRCVYLLRSLSIIDKQYGLQTSILYDVSPKA